MVYLLKMVIFHGYVKQPEGNMNGGLVDQACSLVPDTKLGVILAHKDSYPSPRNWL